ncbi:MAG: MoaD/ThiS family protein [Carboxydocellales bacterium]
MSIIVRLPTSIAYLTGKNEVIECAATSVAQCIQELNLRFSGLKDILCDSEGDVSNLFFIFLNGDNITYLKGMESALKDGDELTIIPVAAGG